MPRLAIDGDSRIHAYIKPLLEQMGKDFTTCEECGDDITGKAVIHHTEYDGATIFDLEVVCQKCNMRSENKGLR
jgi:hypothetical protein